MNKLAIITGFLGGTRNRYMTYQAELTAIIMLITYIPSVSLWLPRLLKS